MRLVEAKRHYREFHSPAAHEIHLEPEPAAAETASENPPIPSETSPAEGPSQNSSADQLTRTDA